MRGESTVHTIHRGGGEEKGGRKKKEKKIVKSSFLDQKIPFSRKEQVLEPYRIELGFFIQS